MEHFDRTILIVVLFVVSRFWLSNLSYACGIIWFLVVCALRKRIHLAIAIVKEASSAISRMPIIILYPVLPIVGFVLFLIPWVVFMLYLASSGEIVTQCICSSKDDYNTTTSTEIEDILRNSEQNGQTLQDACDDGCYVNRTFDYARNTQYAGLYLVFSFFWTTQFITAW